MRAMLTEGKISMSAQPGPHRFEDVRVILAPDGVATTKPVTPNFYAELDGEFNNFSGHILVMSHSYSEAWGMWEMHPMGDEIVVLQEGDVDFVLWRDGEETVLNINEPGSYVVVPRGLWHTARPHKKSSMIFFTPGQGTLNAAAPGGEG
jgi:mannose-6-phosphate isomerase-like protein (cupin superfamily)